MVMRYLLYKLHRLLYPQNVVKLRSLSRAQSHTTDVRMFHALFEVLVTFVEDECASMEMQCQASKYTTVERFAIRWLPRRWRLELSRELGLACLDVLEKSKHEDISRRGNRIKKLYLWYINEYPHIRNPYELYGDPTTFFVDEQGNHTDKMFTNGRLNIFSDEYRAYLDNIRKADAAHETLLNTKMKELVDLRMQLL